MAPNQFAAPTLGAGAIASTSVARKRGLEMERAQIEKLFTELEERPRLQFPKVGEALGAPQNRHGVYVIRNLAGDVEHVGRTLRGKKGLFQRLKNHLQGQSSFVKEHLSGNGSALRDGYTYQYIEVDDDRKHALLECYATAWHCPAHLGLGLSSPRLSNV